MSRAPFRVRASSWAKLWDCAHSFEGTHIMGLKMPSSPRALLGTGIHHGTAVFDAARITGESVDVLTAVEHAIEKIIRPEQDVDWKGSDLTIRQMQEIAAALVTKYCRIISPRYEFAAVEITAKPLVIDCGRGVQIELTGTLDRMRLRKETNGYGIADIKSGRGAVIADTIAQAKRMKTIPIAKTKGHAAQIGTYEILTKHSTGIECTEPADIIGLPTSGDLEPGIGQIVGASERMLGDGESPGLLDFAAEMFASGLFPPNPQSVLCNQKYCARWSRCAFKDQS